MGRAHTPQRERAGHGVTPSRRSRGKKLVRRRPVFTYTGMTHTVKVFRDEEEASGSLGKKGANGEKATTRSGGFSTPKRGGYAADDEGSEKYYPGSHTPRRRLDVLLPPLHHKPKKIKFEPYHIHVEKKEPELLPPLEHDPKKLHFEGINYDVHGSPTIRNSTHHHEYEPPHAAVHAKRDPSIRPTGHSYTPPKSGFGVHAKRSPEISKPGKRSPSLPNYEVGAKRSPEIRRPKTRSPTLPRYRIDAQGRPQLEHGDKTPERKQTPRRNRGSPLLTPGSVPRNVPHVSRSGGKRAHTPGSTIRGKHPASSRTPQRAHEEAGHSPGARRRSPAASKRGGSPAAGPGARQKAAEAEGEAKDLRPSGAPKAERPTRAGPEGSSLYTASAYESTQKTTHDVSVTSTRRAAPQEPSAQRKRRGEKGGGADDGSDAASLSTEPTDSESDEDVGSAAHANTGPPLGSHGRHPSVEALRNEINNARVQTSSGIAQMRRSPEPAQPYTSLGEDADDEGDHPSDVSPRSRAAAAAALSASRQSYSARRDDRSAVQHSSSHSSSHIVSRAEFAEHSLSRASSHSSAHEESSGEVAQSRIRTTEQGVLTLRESSGMRSGESRAVQTIGVDGGVGASSTASAYAAISVLEGDEEVLLAALQREISLVGAMTRERQALTSQLSSLSAANDELFDENEDLVLAVEERDELIRILRSQLEEVSTRAALSAASLSSARESASYSEIERVTESQADALHAYDERVRDLQSRLAMSEEQNRNLALELQRKTETEHAEESERRDDREALADHNRALEEELAEVKAQNEELQGYADELVDALRQSREYVTSVLEETESIKAELAAERERIRQRETALDRYALDLEERLRKQIQSERRAAAEEERERSASEQTRLQEEIERRDKAIEVLRSGYVSQTTSRTERVVRERQAQTLLSYGSHIQKQIDAISQVLKETEADVANPYVEDAFGDDL